MSDDLLIDQATLGQVTVVLDQVAGAVPSAMPPDGSGCGSVAVACQVQDLAAWACAQTATVRARTQDLLADLGAVDTAFDATDRGLVCVGPSWAF